MKIAVIGCGAAGMIAAVFAARGGAAVTVYEKNEKAGKKVYITGKGRCNVTNLCDPQDFLLKVVNGEKFLRSAIYAFPPKAAFEFFESLGLPLKTERGDRVFPVSDKSSDVIKALQKEMNALGVEIIFNAKVDNISKKSENLRLNAKNKGEAAFSDDNGSTKKTDAQPDAQNGLFEITSNGETRRFDKVIVATGGKSYPLTGSTGDGYIFAKQFGLPITEPLPALVPLITEEDVSELEGLSLKNVTLIARGANKREVFSEFGEMLFTKKGLSGPIAISASSYINRIKENVIVAIDLKPALEADTLDNRILRDFDERKNMDIKNAVRALMPERLNAYVLNRAGIDFDKKVNSITKEERARLVSVIKGLEFNISGTAPFNEAVVTSGGVSLCCLKPDCECKNIEGLYFAGEVIDADALTGGFNLQIAYSTAVAAAKSALKK